MSGATTRSLRFLVRGAVQGVGFRPFVFREAVARGLTGWVKNTPSGVEIVAAGNAWTLEDFEAALRNAPPPAAKIISIEVSDAKGEVIPANFYIAESSRDGRTIAHIVPDLATCADCLREINDPGNRRYRYPFTNCTHCGPRYSIILGLPYDRERTTMHPFTMCPACRAEFDHPADRRFHAQPNACPVCGPQLALWDNHGAVLATKDDALLAAAAHIKAGHIVAVKGIGGFHLLCDATNDSTVRTLRARKRREEKPFAVMVPHLESARARAQISEQEAAWLASPAAPIVLLRRKTSTLSEAVAPGNPWLGLFLPYAPLHHLLMQELHIPVVATSGNFSDEPIITSENEAVEKLGGIADYFLVHDRPIAHPVDDSVMRIVLDQPLVLRAARGLAPLSLTAPATASTILATGPHMKVTVALRHHDQIIVSPHIGDIENVSAERAFENTVHIMEHIHDARPDFFACDNHPDYATTKFAARQGGNVLRVQHHHAHVLAVMAEYDLRGPVIGVAWDGTGLGDDGTIWGGEFLMVDPHGYRRMAHLRTFPLPGGDIAAREPRRSALGVLLELGISATEMAFTEREQKTLEQAIRRNINTMRTSSAGRLFDAVAALLGLCQRSSYEGHAAMLLQAKAEEVEHDVAGYPVATNPGAMDWSPVIHGILHDLKMGVDTPVIAARFHQSMVDLIGGAIAQHPDLPVVLCGGCFQNAWLLERTVRRLESMGRKVYWPRLLPPNDGAISAGQAMAHR